MFKCNKCGKEYKMQYHLDKHINKCTVVPNTVDNDLGEQSIADEVETVVGEVCYYYEGLPKDRRKTKLDGLKSRTLDNDERAKIDSLIRGL